MRVLDVRNPRWADKEKTIIVVDVNFEGIPEQYVPFSVSEKDQEAHSKEIYSLVKSGKIGEIK